MAIQNSLIISVGDVFFKGGDPSTRYTINRIEKTVADSGIEQINSIRLKQVAPIEMETEWKNKWTPPTAKLIFVDVSLEELFRNYALISRRDKDESTTQAIIRRKNENRKIFHRIDTAIAQLKEADKIDEWASRRFGEESLHTDMEYLNEVLGPIVVFRAHRWLAKLIHMIDKFGKNYSSSISSPMFEATSGYGFVAVSSKNPIKKLIATGLASLLETLNAKHKFGTAKFEDYPEAAFSGEDAYSIKELVENKHRHNDEWFMKYQAEHGVGREAVVGTEIAGSVQNSQELVKVKVDVDKLPSNEEVIEQLEMMKKYEDKVVEEAEEKRIGNQIGQSINRPTLTPTQIGE
jgi:hypothetical protein